jgi:RimJ/RimL family protein N-acetyltransferase
MVFGWDDRHKAWIDRFIIDPEHWHEGLAADAALALHRYFFDYLDMQRVNATVRADNDAARRIAGTLGYVEFAHGHDVFFRDGAYVDELWLMMERSAWDERWAHEREYAAPVAR